MLVIKSLDKIYLKMINKFFFNSFSSPILFLFFPLPIASYTNFILCHLFFSSFFCTFLTHTISFSLFHS